MFNIFRHQENANYNYVDISSYPVRMAEIQNTNVGVDVKRGNTYSLHVGV